MTNAPHPQTDGPVENVDVVILGAGLAGLTAAHELADARVAVLERRDRVGGRTLSGGDESSWFNVGAQLIANERLVALATSLGLELISLAPSEFGFVVDGKFARASSPERLLLKMNLSLRDKASFATSALRLRRLLARVQTMTADDRAELDGQPLVEVIGRVTPTTLRMLSDCCENAAGLPASGASGLFGLSYGLGAFLDPASKKHLYGVRGGTQQITLALAGSLPSGTVRLGAEVQSVTSTAEGVDVVYSRRDGSSARIFARQCISAMPARQALDLIADLPEAKVKALRNLTPYSSLISVAWPVADGVATPWDGLFVCPVSGRQGFNLLTNYGFLSKHLDPRRGGFLNTLSAGAKADLFEELEDSAIVDRQFDELVSLFPQARTLLDKNGAVVQRWRREGLPPMRPGYLADREELRRSVGNVHFCGDYTAEPGLPGAHGSGRYAAKTVKGLLGRAHPIPT